MGLGDRFKDIAKQAQDAVVEHKDQFHEAVDAAGVAADRKTRGKHTARIAKFGQKAGDAIDRLGGETTQPEPAAPESAAPESAAPESAGAADQAPESATGTTPPTAR